MITTTITATATAIIMFLFLPGPSNIAIALSHSEVRPGEPSRRARSVMLRLMVGKLIAIEVEHKEANGR